MQTALAESNYSSRLEFRVCVINDHYLFKASIWTKQSRQQFI